MDEWLEDGVKFWHWSRITEEGSSEHQTNREQSGNEIGLSEALISSRHCRYGDVWIGETDYNLVPQARNILQWHLITSFNKPYRPILASYPPLEQKTRCVFRHSTRWTSSCEKLANLVSSCTEVDRIFKRKLFLFDCQSITAESSFLWRDGSQLNLTYPDLIEPCLNRLRGDKNGRCVERSSFSPFFSQDSTKSSVGLSKEKKAIDWWW